MDRCGSDIPATAQGADLTPRARTPVAATRAVGYVS